ncbi:PLP-dependent aminotransferase family protein [Sinirhodobacter populi]|uniref:PLP-dependent aminotransferase family protein n=1 Tax=Paenirhodobacter populi TaxID=2306993 RepID=A0A443K4K1_9RHOB|nr:PLP-dependent aminotransferase family protein [Sinirhodobacter populi]RWR27708.1 PLP-dependent aminotransferase family protein [Sinirhodobacter populi]
MPPTPRQSPEAVLAQMSRSLPQPSAKGIAAVLAHLIHDGQIMPGDRLPTVREVATVLKVSAPTVASAWADLREQGILETRRRGGTFVMPFRDKPMFLPRSGRSRSRWIDLAFGVADPALLPPLGEALANGLVVAQLHDPQKDHAIPALVEAIGRTIPFAPEAWSTASNGSEATLLVLSALTQRGSRVAVEQPSSPRLMDIMQTLGLEVIPVACDASGPLPAALQTALQKDPALFLYQPRGQIPLGHSVPAERIAELAQVLAERPEIMVIEDDNIGPLSASEFVSTGSHLPGKVVVIRTYCRAYGVDLRCSVYAGPQALLRKAQSLRSHGAAMNSRILQGTLAWLVSDAKTTALIGRAAQTYTRRRGNLAAALARQGIETQGHDGVFLWVPVRSERAAVAALGKHNIGVAAGSACYASFRAESHIRVSVTLLPDESESVELIAQMIAEAASFQDPESLA